MNRAKTRMTQCAVSNGKLASAARILSQPERSLVLDILFLDRPELMPQKKNSCHHQTDYKANQEKPAVSGKRNQKNYHHANGNDQTRRAAEGCLRLAEFKIRFHHNIPLTPPF
jgi:hypothetical protein